MLAVSSSRFVAVSSIVISLFLIYVTLVLIVALLIKVCPRPPFITVFSLFYALRCSSESILHHLGYYLFFKMLLLSGRTCRFPTMSHLIDSTTFSTPVFVSHVPFLFPIPVLQTSYAALCMELRPGSR
jgi:hypothetical protein